MHQSKGDGHPTRASRVREHVRVTGVKHCRCVHAPLHTQCRSKMSQSAATTLICVGYRSRRPPLPFRLIIIFPSSYQQRASVPVASSDRDSRSPRSQGDRRQVRPHLCAPSTRLCHRPLRSTTSTTSTAKHHKCRSIARSATTVVSVAAMRCVAVPELPVGVAAPALDAPVVLRSAASLNIHQEIGRGAGRVISSALHRSNHVLASC